jgi:hypothetical protein
VGTCGYRARHARVGRARTARNDVHDPADGVGAELRGARAPQNLDALDVRRHYRRQVRAAAAQVGRVAHAHAVHEDEDVVGLRSTDVEVGLAAGIADSIHVQARRFAKEVWQGGRLPGFDLRAVDDADGLRCVLPQQRRALAEDLDDLVPAGLFGNQGDEGDGQRKGGEAHGHASLDA